MSLVIDLPEDTETALKAKAAAEGLDVECYVRRMLERDLEVPKAAARILELQKRVKPDPEGWTVHDYIDHGRA
jgi:plasmid stability protein